MALVRARRTQHQRQGHRRRARQSTFPLSVPQGILPPHQDH